MQAYTDRHDNLIAMSRSAVFLLIAIALLALAVLDPVIPSVVVTVLILVWFLIGLRQNIDAAVAVLVPMIAVAVRPDAASLIAGGMGGIAVWVVMSLQAREQRRQQALQPVRMHVHTYVYQQKLLQRQVQRYPLLVDLCSTLFTAQERGQFANTLCAYVRHLLPEANLVTVTLSDGGRHAFAYGRGATPVPETLQRGQRFVLIEQRLMVQHSDGQVHAFIPLRGSQTASAGDELRGVLTVGFPSQGFEDHLLVEVLGALGRMAGLSLASVRLLEQARSLALHDDLTGLFGRHEFFRRLEEMISDARRQKHEVAVVMCDMDHLKDFNDQYGHPAGDLALRAIADRIRNCLPSDAIACRYGGEEFALAVPRLEDPQALAERLRAAIEQLLLPDQARVTASLGWALRHSDEDAYAVMERADQACYQAKHQGRNRVVGAMT